ncbi:DUF2232 domain-containing protein [Phreatobacter aquaticus]|uniref:DUF2232 domain-containing protein n=1 Tax=Phreatobacter aquaticus TaxID=2570229 RepID=A0A4D7QK55_9HYPH|nr:DUF2232 domain-containing protein [Phreatobacter aquaticus]QCK87001.1 DUF2232 domain-containing protein [Phreatobacter aquaticus]
MGPTLAIAFGAGLASALLFATLASGSAIALVLFYFAALPVLIAGLGWGHYAGAFAGTIGALALSIAMRSQLGVFFFLSVGLPAWILSYLTVATLPARSDDDQPYRWSEPGTILSVIGLGAVLLTLFGIVVLFGFDFDAYQASLRQSVDRALAAMALPASDGQRMLGAFMAVALPIAAAIIWTFVTTLNLYVAAKIVRASGRLPRPWPDLASLRLPKAAAGAMLFGSLLSFLSGMPGHVGVIVLSVGLAIFALAGFALAHDMTRGWGMRGFALGLLYALTFVIGWPMIFVAMAGLADTLFDLRSRRSAPPPSL